VLLIYGPVSIPKRLEFFSLGGVLATFWRPRRVALPWIVSAVLLMMLGGWDLLRGMGRFDLVMGGLAGYELVLGLTEDPAVLS
jgi:hypothetical protein